jgi:hypothetical protein
VLLRCCTIIVLVVCGSNASLRAQEVVPARTAGDSALNTGDLARAESLYYAATRARPRDPLSREALGRYVGMRGATRVAVVLLEEARLFGADPSRIAIELAPLYSSLGDWRALLTLQSSPLSASERTRAAWLSEHPATSRADTASTAIVGSVRGDTLGRIPIRVGSRTAMAVVLAQDVGLTIGVRLAGGVVHLFGGDSSVATIDQMSAGSAHLGNIRVNVGGPPAGASVGLSELAPLVPTFDYAKNRLTFNRPLSILAPIRLPMVRYNGAIRVLDHGRWVTLGDYVAGAAKARQTITIDFRAGEVRVLP